MSHFRLTAVDLLLQCCYNAAMLNPKGKLVFGCLRGSTLQQSGVNSTFCCMLLQYTRYFIDS